MTAQDDLARVVEPPRRSLAASVDWAALEARIGTALPSDYRWLVEHYGPGSFDEFLHVFQPVATHEAIRLEHVIEGASWTLDQIRESGEVIPFSNEELLPVAQTDNGDSVYWLRRPNDDPEQWTIVVNEPRGPEWVSFDGGLVAFLAAVLGGSFVASIFPDDFPSEEPVFEPYEA